ncbi:S8 family serine peptidase [Bordetella pseudohinzii]|uniref:S8 family serine peptidase n=1 Tax=Bordetella pseudohinzii TaxID=1331258 RepID=UPI000D6E09D9
MHPQYAAVPAVLPEVQQANVAAAPVPTAAYARPAPSAFSSRGSFNETHDRILNTVNLKTAHDAGILGSRVKVAVVDNGVSRNHNLLDVNTRHGGDYNANGAHTPADPARQGEHGSSVALVLAARSNASFRGGIAPNAELYSANIGTAHDLVSETAAFHAWNDLLGQGVKIFNNSFSSDGADGDQRVQAARDEYLQAADKSNTHIGKLDALVRRGALLIFAAGNGNAFSGRAYQEVGTFGRSPLTEPNLQKGLLVVTAVDQWGTLESWANRCGAAQQWCLAAGSTTYLPGVKAYDAYVLTIHKGTSLAAPQVTGAAVLVQQRFPWMDNDNLRTTLLTTAKDKGRPGVDSQYGWGLLDIGRAIEGPAQFPFGDFVAKVSGESVFGNDISGTGGLAIDGPGKLTLAGHNTYSGPTRIKAGTLDVLGSITSATTVEQQGTLVGTGSVGSVSNQGTVVIKEAGLTVNGNFTQSAQGRLVADIGSLLAVTGKASLAGQLHIQGIRPGYVVAEGSVHTLVQAAAIEGRFDTLTRSPGLLLHAQLDYQPQAVGLAVRRVGSVQAVAARLFSRSAPVAAAAQQLDAAMEELDALPQAQRAASAPADAISRLQHVQSRSALRDSLYSLSASTYANAAALNTLGQNDWMDRLQASLARTPGRAIAEYRHGRVHWRPEGLDGKQHGNGLLMGFTRALGPQLTLGAALTHDRGNWRESTASGSQDHARSTAPGIILGLRRQWDEGGFVHASLGYSRYRNRVTRHIMLDDVRQQASGSARGDIWQAGLGAGRRWQLGQGSAITPSAGMLLTYLRQAGFTEDNPSGLGVRAASLDRAVPTLWARLEGDHAIDDALALQWRLAMHHDARERQYAARSGFAGLERMHGVSGHWSVPRTRVSAQLGLQAQLAPGLQLGLRYTGQAAARWRDHQLGLGLSYRY